MFTLRSANMQAVRSSLRLIASLLLASATSVTAQNNAGTVSLSPAANVQSANGLSVVLSPSFAGMGIEPSNLLSFTGSGSVNQLTYQLLSNLANYSGVPPHLRIGGNSGDNMIYGPNESGIGLITNSNPHGQGNTPTDKFIIGPGFFNSLDLMPPNTPITYGLNLAYNGSDAVDRLVEQAEAAFTLLQNVKIVSLEIGNEPDLYLINGYRDSGWTVNNFGSEWSTRAQAVNNQVLKKRNLPTNFFEPAVTATTATSSGHAYRISNLVNTGVAVDNGIYVAGWNQHDYFYYVGVSTYELSSGYLLDLSNTYKQFGEWANQAQSAAVTGKPYYLREMGAVGPTGIQGISDTFANTLWTLNFFLYAATIKVSSVQMHMTDNSYGSPWQPGNANGVGPHVRSSYYAFAAMSQIVGAQCNTRIGTLMIGNVPGAYNSHLAAYSVYRGNDLASTVLINTQESQSYVYPKNSISFSVSLPKMAGQTAYLSYLTAQGSDSKQNTTWNNLSFEQSNTGAPTTVNDGNTATVQVGSDGTLIIPVRDSQAVVAAFGAPIGSNNQVDQNNCKSLSANTSEGGETSPDATSAPLPTFKAVTGFPSDGQLSTAAILGIAVSVFSVIFFFGLAIFLCVCLRRRRRQRAYMQKRLYSSTDMITTDTRRRSSARIMSERPGSAFVAARIIHEGEQSGNTLVYSQEQHGHGRYDSTGLPDLHRYPGGGDGGTWTPPDARYIHVRTGSEDATPSSSKTWYKNDVAGGVSKQRSSDWHRQSMS
ncbi:glycoside hydrolase family 79 protein [Tilletiaria anomala UBC 951]|uniref:Glycoside hydrolase family 79 protein n=1 Tax=Tilletiaria anomala (strain ATCC 24038 / CBS 436.72 / UBC 951) TaxID=1037660 RepID=A0A066WIN6_TILAU|nr:glycoside hydrolase family 79 protein [Tilletiaria anomala UBC 951]KDN52398.1 glycoside hydrolase family 79 protein [Tilletiaria anomala UBC 951]